MSYTEQVGPYLIPNIPLATTTAGVLREIDIGAASADHGEMLCVRACLVKRLMFTPVGELAGGTTTAPTVVFTKRPTPLSATGETAMGTVTVPEASPIGTTTFKDVQVRLAVGDSVQIAHTIGVGTPTGIGFWSMDLVDCPDEHTNNTELVASTT